VADRASEVCRMTVPLSSERGRRRARVEFWILIVPQFEIQTLPAGFAETMAQGWKFGQAKHPMRAERNGSTVRRDS
jgi:hypothetical protein